MNRIYIEATSQWAPVGTSIGDYHQRQHHSLLDGAFKNRGILGTLNWVATGAQIAADLSSEQMTPQDRLFALANDVLAGAQEAAFGIAGATITTAVSGWAAGGAVGVLTGNQAAKSLPPLERLVIMLAGGAIGAAITSKIRADIPIFRLAQQSDGSLHWVAVPFGIATPQKFSLA
jgi:hypothetical protein